MWFLMGLKGNFQIHCLHQIWFSNWINQPLYFLFKLEFVSASKTTLEIICIVNFESHLSQFFMDYLVSRVMSFIPIFSALNSLSILNHCHIVNHAELLSLLDQLWANSFCLKVCDQGLQRVGEIIKVIYSWTIYKYEWIQVTLYVVRNFFPILLTLM